MVVNFFQLVLGWIHSVPDVIWSGVFASLITVGGVWKTNRSSDRRAEHGLEHDATQKDLERQLSLKKEVYLPAVTGVAKALGSLGRLSDHRYPTVELDKDIYDGMAAVPRALVVGSEETVEAVGALTKEITRAYMEISLQRMQLIFRENRINQFLKVIELRSTQIEGYLNQQKQFNLEGRTDARQWDVLSQMLQSEVRQRDEAWEEVRKLQSEQAIEQIKYVEFATNRLVEVRKFQPAALSAVRKELGLPTSEEFFRKHAEETSSYMRDTIHAALSELRKIAQ